MRERYIFSYPSARSILPLVAEDETGQVLTEGVAWTMDDPSIGDLVPALNNPGYMSFDPKRAGESRVVASHDQAMDEARIVVYPGMMVPNNLPGFDFSEGKWTGFPSEGDIWWPGGGVFRFECGYWTDTSILAILEALDAITAEGKELSAGPFTYTYYPNADQLFLVRTREGAVYAAIINGGSLVYKPTPLIPAP